MNTPRKGRTKQAREDKAKAHKVYVATAWWHDCDPFASVAANTPEVAEKQIMRAIRDAATDTYNQSEPEDERTIEDFMHDIGWSGVNDFRLADVVSDKEFDNYFAHVASTLDHCDMESLLRGDKDAYLWLDIS